MDKGEIARHEQFLFFSHSVFKRLVLQTGKNQGLIGKGFKSPFKFNLLILSKELAQFHFSCKCIGCWAVVNAYIGCWAQIKDLFGKLQIKLGWLVVLGFNATLTAKVISWRSVTHMCFLVFSHQY